MSDAGWTREPPVDIGFYWARSPWMGAPRIVEVYHSAQCGELRFRFNHNRACHIQDGLEWSGPIAPPRDDVVKEDA